MNRCTWEKIYIYSEIATAGKELQKNQLLYICKYKIQKKTHQEKRKKNLKMIFKISFLPFLFFFFDKKHKEKNSTAPQKANVMVNICQGINSVIFKNIES